MSRPAPSSPGVTTRMSKQRRRDTKPEIDLRRLLHAKGLRYRVAWPIPGLRRRTVDIAFTRRRVAVFVDGCFWHSCPEHGTEPNANGAWWYDKLAANQRRDRTTDTHLASLGWTVVRVWEHEPAPEAADRVEAALDGRRERGNQADPTRRVRPPDTPRGG